MTTNPMSTPRPWDMTAEDYAVESVPYLEKYAVDALALTPIAAGAAVIDLACGPGTITIPLARAGARVVAVDFSEKMLAVLRKRARDAGVVGIEIHHGDGQRLPFDAASFDAAFSMFGLIFFPDPEHGVRELRRVLRPNGSVTVSSWAPLDSIPFFAEVWGAIRKALPEVPFGGGKAPLGRPSDLVGALTSAGLRDVTVHPISHPWTFASLHDAWSTFLKTTPPLVLLRSDLDEGRWRRFTADIYERLVDRLGPGGLTLDLTAYLGLGRA